MAMRITKVLGQKVMNSYRHYASTYVDFKGNNG